jgi:hypothetical protein
MLMVIWKIDEFHVVDIGSPKVMTLGISGSHPNGEFSDIQKDR